ncbi:uncharacterized protein K452DRAFT_318239 [Aplosporella prunicola CBS 121167]|uniref:Cell wall anchored protein n=1 Tax=Aplosporella prunicola CBS 121167 TaxID=1176127 RepID=A0A6A6BF10_9PEZI|nr:uncharacterized protein K452DRAFT_318239 [Aplosporella prunicola CBS 121167]KAF2142656.1 hypothetical protein K452DRAFT_318239 [Aplosporella prunicola CBS 121167]
MAAVLLRFVIFLTLAASSAHAKDPLKDFCRRFGHQTAVVDRRLYIDGGQVTWNPMSQNPLNYSNTWLLYNDLDETFQGMPQLHEDLNKTSSIPDVSGGILWTDEVNKVLYQYGGEFTDSPESFTPWAYDIIHNQWNQTSISAASNIQRVAWGAGVTVNETAVGYYLGGWLSSQTVPGWEGNPVLTSNLLSYDMIADRWINATGPDDNIGRAEGTMVFLPASDGGLLIYFGGVQDPNRNGTIEGANMSTIHIYDIASTKWYTQQASGDIPDDRRKFCGGATWAQDKSSYNIYIYGGQGITNTTGFDDVYILSIPSFIWIKWYPTQPGPGNPHGISSCNVINNAQMIIVGGWFAQHDQCDAPNIWGTHNLNLGANGPNNNMWDFYYPNITQYLVPPEIISKIGGGSTGGATVKSPEDDWGHRDLPVYFGRQAQFSARTATREIPEATGTSSSKGDKKNGGSGSHTAAIAGGAAGGGVGLILIVALVFYCLWRRRKNNPKEKKERPPSELPAAPPAELAAANSFREAKSASSPSGSNATPAYTHDGSTHTGGGSPIGGAAFPVSPQTPYTPGTPSQQALWSQQQQQYMQPPSPNSPQYPGGVYAPPPQQHYPAPQPANPPYDPSQHALHQEHFPPPPSASVGPGGAGGGGGGLAAPGGYGVGAPTPSDYSQSQSHSYSQSRSGAESDDGTAGSPMYPPTTSNTPAHFYPQPLQLAGSRQASATRPGAGSPGGSSTGGEGVPLVSRIAESVGQSPGPGQQRVRMPQPVRGRFREESEGV